MKLISFSLVFIPIVRAFISPKSILKGHVLMQSQSDDILAEFKDELISLRGTPELVDRLENLASKYPGLEVIYI